MPKDSEKYNEIESEVYDEFLSTELDDQEHKQNCDDNGIRPSRTLVTLFLAALTLSSVMLLIYQTQYQLFAKSSHSSSSSSSTTSSLSSPSSGSKKSSSDEGSIGNSTNSKTSDSNHLGSVDPTHCDETGYPSCFSIGYSDGQNAPGTSCPTGHSTSFCKGWNAGTQSASTSSSSSNSNSQNTNSSAGINGRINSGKESVVVGAVAAHHKLRSTVKHSSEVNQDQQSQTNTNANITNSSSPINSKPNIRNNANESSNLLNLLPSHKFRSHNSLSLNQNNKASINQTGQTNTGSNITNSPRSNANSKSNFNNNAKIISNINSPSLSTSHTVNSNPSFVKQKSNLKIDQAGQTNANVNVTNSPNSHVKSESSISNNANVNSNVNSNVNNNPSKYAGSTSSSPSASITQNSKNTINQGAQNNANINVNNSPGTHIVNEQTIKQSVRINNEVNNIIKNNAVNKIVQENNPSSPQLTDIMTVKVGKSSMSSGALFPLADVAPYRIIGGHLTANLPSNSQQNIVVAQVSDSGNIEHAVILDLNQITGSNLNQNSLYETNLGSDISGTNPFTGNQDEVSSITNLFLWNNNQQPIVFDDANGVTMDLIYK